jgi:hypothetical protein
VTSGADESRRVVVAFEPEEEPRAATTLGRRQTRQSRSRSCWQPGRATSGAAVSVAQTRHVSRQRPVEVRPIVESSHRL